MYIYMYTSFVNESVLSREVVFKYFLFLFLIWKILIFRLSLNTMTLHIESSNVYTQYGVAISVTGVAQVRWPIF